MLPKIINSLRSFVSGDHATSNVRRTKRQLESHDDDVQCSPAKRARAEPPPAPQAPFWKLSYNKLAELAGKIEHFVRRSPASRNSYSLSQPRFGNKYPTMAGMNVESEIQNPELKDPAYLASSYNMVEKNRNYVHSTPKRDVLPGLPYEYSDMGQNLCAPPNIALGADGQFQISHGDGQFKVPPRPYPAPVMDHPMPRPPIRPGGCYAIPPQFNGTPRPNTPAVYRSMYEKNFPTMRPHNQPVTIQPTRSKNKMAAKESIKLEEKSRYAQLLQQFTSTPLDACMRANNPHNDSSRSSFNESQFRETILGTPIDHSRRRISTSSDSIEAVTVQPKPVLPERSFSHLRARRAEQLERSSIDPSPITVKSTSSDDESIIVVSDNGTKKSHSSSIRTFSRHPSEDSVYITKVEPPKPDFRPLAQELFEKSLNNSVNEKMDWLDDLKENYSAKTREKELKIRENATKTDFFKEKRSAWEQHLENRILLKLRLSSRETPVLEDLPVEEEEDEFPELTDEMEKQVDNALRKNPPNEVLSEGFRLKITRHDMETLRSLNWLNDEIINFYMELLRDRGTQEGMATVHIFNTFFYPQVMSRGHAGVKRWTKRVDIFGVDLILIPVHLGMHWCLAVIDIQEKSIKYYDSMGGNNRACLNALSKYLEAESMDKKNQKLDTSGWTKEIVKNIPQQMNGSDCGVFTCKYAEYISRRKPFSFTQEHMPYFRRRMVYEILKKKLL